MPLLWKNMSTKQFPKGRCSLKRGFTRVELLVVIAILGVLVAFLSPVQATRETPRRMERFGNLKFRGTTHNDTFKHGFTLASVADRLSDTLRLGAETLSLPLQVERKGAQQGSRLLRHDFSERHGEGQRGLRPVVSHVQREELIFCRSDACPGRWRGAAPSPNDGFSHWQLLGRPPC